MIINYNGKDYEITNWEEFKNKLLLAIGFQIESEVTKQINDMGLVDTGAFKGSTFSVVEGNDLIITNTAPYAVYLEYGTFAYWDKHGETSFPATPDPKKKDLPYKDRKRYPKGMQPFAPFRRVLWNEQKMNNIINKAVRAATK